MRVLAWTAYKIPENPYNWLLYTHLSQLGIEIIEFSPTKILWEKYDIWHIHWPDHLLNNPNLLVAFFKSFVLILLMAWARLRGVKIIWTAHNLQSHEGFHPKLESGFWKEFTRGINGYISLTKCGRQLAQECHPALAKVPGFVVPHGHYRGMYTNEVTKEEARQHLNIEAQKRVIAYIGNIRPYKNVPLLIKTFRQLGDSETLLVITGRSSSGDLVDEIHRSAANDPRVRIYLDFVPATAMQFYLKAADLVLLPYERIFNSGSALLALSFDVPVMLPKVEAMLELQSLVGNDWVFIYDGRLSPESLTAGLSWALQTQRPIRAPLDFLNWERIAAQTLEAYAAI